MFSIDLYQVIENDKAVDKVHEVVMAKLDVLDEDESIETNSELLPTFPDNHSQLFTRRNSDPVTERFSFSYSTKTEDEEDSETNYMLNALRTIGTLKEEDEEDSLSCKRKSRLIEALTLSSTSASSMCILDRDTDLTPPTPQVPKVMLQTIDYITKYALNTIGIFRTGGSKKRVRQVRYVIYFYFYLLINQMGNTILEIATWLYFFKHDTNL